MNTDLITHIVQQQLQSLLGSLPENSDIQLDIQSELNRYQIKLNFGFPIGLYVNALQETLVTKLQQALPDASCDIHLQTHIRPYITQMPGKSLRGIKNTIAIASGKGGVGKSTVTVNLAIALANMGARVGILDADIYGPSIPLMLGKTPPLSFQQETVMPVHKYGVQAMSIGYLTQDEKPLIWRGPMLAKSLIQMINMTYWDELDYLLIDLPPGTGDIQLSLVQKIPLTGAVIVTTPQPVATLDAEKALRMFQTTGIEILGIIENMSQHTCRQCGHQDSIFQGQGVQNLCQQYHCKCLAQLPLDADISQHCDEGMPSAARAHSPLHTLFSQAALNMAVELSKKPINYADKFPPIMVEQE